MAENPFNNILGTIGDLAGKVGNAIGGAASKAAEAGKAGVSKAGEALRNRVHPNDPRRPGGAGKQAQNILDRPHPRFPGPLMPNARVVNENVAVGRDGGRINDGALQPQIKPEAVPPDENPIINKQILGLHRRAEADVLHNNGMPVPDWARNNIKGRDDLRDAVIGPTAATFNPDMVRAVEKWAQTIYSDPRTAGSKAEFDTARELHGIYRSYQMHKATADSPDAAPDVKAAAAEKVAQLRKSLQAYIEHVAHGFILKRGHGRINDGRFELRNGNTWAPAQAENADVDARQQEIYSDVKPQPLEPRLPPVPAPKKPDFKGPKWEVDPDPVAAPKLDDEVDGLIKKFNLSRNGKPLRYQQPAAPAPSTADPAFREAAKRFREHNQRQGVLGFPDASKGLPGVRNQPAQPAPYRSTPPVPGADPRIGRNLPADYDISRHEKGLELDNLDAQREAAARKRAAQQRTAPAAPPRPRLPGEKPAAPPTEAAPAPAAAAPAAPAPADKLGRFQAYVDKGLSSGRLLLTYDEKGAAYIKNMENPESQPVPISEIEKAMPGFKAPPPRKAPPANIAPRIPDEAIKQSRTGQPLRYSAEQLQAIVRQNAGGGVSAGSMATMQRFLQDLQEHNPEKLEKMLSSNHVNERSEHYQWLDSLGDSTKQFLKHLAGQKPDIGGAAQRVHPKIGKLAKQVLTDPMSYRRSLRDLHHALMEAGHYGPGSRPVWPDRERLLEVAGKLKATGRTGELDAYLKGVHAGKPMVDLEETSVPHQQEPSQKEAKEPCEGCSGGMKEQVTRLQERGVPLHGLPQ